MSNPNATLSSFLDLRLFPQNLELATRVASPGNASLGKIGERDIEPNGASASTMMALPTAVLVVPALYRCDITYREEGHLPFQRLTVEAV